MQLLWRPPPPTPTALRLEPTDMTFAEVLVGIAAEAAPCRRFEIINAGCAAAKRTARAAARVLN